MSFTTGGGGMRDSPAVFNRFWRHYEASMAWMRAHYVTINRINDEYAREATAATISTAQTTQTNEESVRQKSPRGPSNSKRRKFHGATPIGPESTSQQRRPKPGSDSHHIDPTYEGDKDGGDCELNMDESEEATEAISDDVLEFFEISRRHREQRDLEASQRHYENLENLMISSRPSAVNSGQDTSAVFEARQREMKELYGSQAATIHGMEMAMQCGFERFAQADVKLWPNIPMRM